jgi:hypothetical protein
MNDIRLLFEVVYCIDSVNRGIYHSYTGYLSLLVKTAKQT